MGDWSKMTEEQKQRHREADARYRQRNLERIRAYNKERQYRKRREQGMPEMGSPESSENRRRARKLSGSDHQNWKGDDVGYYALHAWVDRHLTKTGTCVKCGRIPASFSDGKSGTQWANISGEYLRQLDDYIELCQFCHFRMDQKTHCVNGHPFDEENTQVNDKGWRKCKACKREETARYRAKKGVTSSRSAS